MSWMWLLLLIYGKNFNVTYIVLLLKKDLLKKGLIQKKGGADDSRDIFPLEKRILGILHLMVFGGWKILNNLEELLNCCC